VTPDQIIAVWRSGGTLRWHANQSHALRQSQDSVAGHQCRTAQLLFALHPAPTCDLIFAALHHDAAEAGTGDLPAPAKRRWPTLKCAYQQAEAGVQADLGLLFALTRAEQDWLALADRMDALLWVQHIDPAATLRPDWHAHVNDVLKRAAALGCSHAVMEVLSA